MLFPLLRQTPLPSPACSTLILLPGEPLGSSDTPLPTSPLVPAGGMDSPCLRPSGSPGAYEQRRRPYGMSRTPIQTRCQTHARFTYPTLTYVSWHRCFATKPASQSHCHLHPYFLRLPAKQLLFNYCLQMPTYEPDNCMQNTASITA